MNSMARLSSCCRFFNRFSTWALIERRDWLIINQEARPRVVGFVRCVRALIGCANQRCNITVAGYDNRKTQRKNFIDVWEVAIILLKSNSN